MTLLELTIMQTKRKKNKNKFAVHLQKINLFSRANNQYIQIIDITRIVGNQKVKILEF